MSTWRAGSATTRFDVPPDTALGGYADREGRSTGTLDALEISALALCAEDERLCLISADLVAVDDDLPHDIAAAAGVDASRVLLCATHTHSGPLGVPHRVHPASPITEDPDLRSRFIDVAADTLSTALAHLAPASLIHGQCRISDVWLNRNEPDGPNDERVRYIAARRPDGSLLAMLLLVPCHPTVLGAWNLDISADLHGGIRRAIRSLLPLQVADPPILAITGAAGDISTRFTRRESSCKEVDRLGSLVCEALAPQMGRGTAIPPRLRGATCHIELPIRSLSPGQPDRELQLADSAWLAIEADASATDADRRRAYTTLQGARIQQQMGTVRPVQAALSAWLLGNEFGLVTIPGELFASLGAAIEAQSPFPVTWIAGYANGYVGYLADDAARDAGTYEAFASPFAPGASSLVVESAIDLLHELSELD